jgi:hypothetical protein
LAGRSRSTFGKRLKETKRLEKRQEKAARKDQRKQEKGSSGEPNFEMGSREDFEGAPMLDEDEILGSLADPNAR